MSAFKLVEELGGYVVDGEVWALPFLVGALPCPVLLAYTWCTKTLTGREPEFPEAVQRWLDSLLPTVKRFRHVIAGAYLLVFTALVVGVIVGGFVVMRDEYQSHA